MYQGFAMKIRILNLPRDVEEEMLKGLFANYGEVQACSIVLDKETGKSKGFGFVEMENATEAEAAISALHGSQVGNQKIRVKLGD